jgi:hypothetical protein
MAIERFAEALKEAKVAQINRMIGEMLEDGRLEYDFERDKVRLKEPADE